MSGSKDGHVSELTQAERFAQAARDLDCDTDEKRWDAKLKKVVKHKPVPEKPA